ncbi:MAG: hypothetical protein Q8P21_00535 [bacterium]|nr:hypothetical protein [bacterium]
MSDFTPEKLNRLRLDMYRFSRRIGLEETIAQAVAQNAADSVRGIGQHDGCENDRENARRIHAEVRQFCIEALQYSSTWAEMIARHAVFCGNVLPVHWNLPALHCDLPRDHSLKQCEDSKDAKGRRWAYNHLYKKTDITTVTS